MHSTTLPRPASLSYPNPHAPTEPASKRVHCLWLVACLLLFGVTGCSYRLVRYEGALGALRTIAIAPIENSSYEPGLDLVVTEALLQEFLRRKALTVVDDVEQADLVISGQVLPVRTVSRSFSSSVMALEYETTIQLALQVKQKGVEAPITLRDLQESEIYLASADLGVTRKNRDEALRRIAVLLAGRSHDLLYEQLAP